ncbi:hypothetical protein WDZ92_42025, partial [Nostoc sp. NIES-2111]
WIRDRGGGYGGRGDPPALCDQRPVALREHRGMAGALHAEVPRLTTPSHLFTTEQRPLVGGEHGTMVRWPSKPRGGGGRGRGKQMQGPVTLSIHFIGVIWTMVACSTPPTPVGAMAAREAQVGGGESWPLSRQCRSAPRGTSRRWRFAPSDGGSPGLRNPPQPLERYPAPEGWGGDQTAVVDPRVGAG